MPHNMDYFPEFMAKRMNFPIGNKELEVATWDDILAANRPLIDLTGFECVGGVDYAKTNDFVACCLVFRVDKVYYVIHHTFVCMKSRDLPGIKAPLEKYAKMGHLTFVNDVEISPDYVVNWFYEMGSKYNILKIAIDNFRYSLLNSTFKKIGFDAFEKKNIRLIRPNDIMKVAPIINSVFTSRKLCVGRCIGRWYKSYNVLVYT